MDGEFEEAQSLLRGLAVERERMHVYDMFTSYGTLSMLHMAKGDDTAAQRFLATLEPLVETKDDERRFTQARELVNRVMPKGVFGRSADAWRVCHRNHTNDVHEASVAMVLSVAGRYG